MRRVRVNYRKTKVVFAGVNGTFYRFRVAPTDGAGNVGSASKTKTVRCGK